MTYTKQTWTAGSGGGTPLSAGRFQHIEDGLEAVANGANLFLALALVSDRATTTTAAGTTTLTIADKQVQVFTGTTTQTVKLPTTGVIAGMPYVMINSSTGTVSIQSSAGNAIFSLTGGRIVILMAKVDTPTGASDWIATGLQLSATAQATTTAQRDSSANLVANNFLPGFATTTTAAGTTTLNVGSAAVQVFTGTTTQTVTLPTSSVPAGQTFRFINNSTGTVTINSSGGGLVKTLAAGATTEIIALQATPTTAAHWSAT